MNYPKMQAVHDAQDSGDVHCLKVWHNELPSPRSSHQRETMIAIETALVALGVIDAEEYHEQHSLFELGGEA